MTTFARLSRSLGVSLALLMGSLPALSAGEREPGQAANGPAAGNSQARSARAPRSRKKIPRTAAEIRHEEMSTMGAMAAGLIPLPAAITPRPDGASKLGVPGPPARVATIGSADVIVHGSGDVGIQTETSIASNTAGTVLIAGYNDFRGFSFLPRSLSGIARSTDGGANWTEVGRLPAPTGGEVFGDPDVKYDPISDKFVYASIYVRPSDGLQGLCIHVSTDGTGAAWTGPIEVSPAFVATGAADKEFMDINRLTGRILLTWTHFPNAGGLSIRGTYSDNLGVTWAPVAIIAPSPAGGFVQSSMPRFDPVTDNTDSVAYVVWRSIAGTGLRNTGCSRSTDGGNTWSAPVNLDLAAFPPEDQILGVDRINTSPALDVHDSTGRVYVVYQRNNLVGTGDVAMRTFMGPCVAGTPSLLSSDPGNDRAQFYPSVTVDQSNGRVHAMWVDQDPEPTGDLHEMMYSSSTDAGATWSRPTPLLDRPFRAGFGNDTSQPNIGDYNQNIALNGVHHSLHGATSVAPRFDEGQPTSGNLFTPDTYYDKRLDSQAVVSLRHVGTAFTESGCGAANGNIDVGETVSFTFTLENYVGNAVVGATTITGISATLSTATPGVTIGTGASGYPNIAPLGTAGNATPLSITLAPAFTPGIYLDLLLTVTSAQGSTELPIRLPTGSPGATTTLINENFEGVTAPALPAGWSTANGGNAPLDAWITSTTLTPTNAVFHDNDGTQTEFMRLLSPVVDVPSVASGVESYVTVDFDIAYKLEDEPLAQVLAYDGLTLRITDQTPGSLLRSVLAEAFGESIRTGSSNHFPKHLPRSNSQNYFEDMSVWSGDSGGVIRVSMKFPGAGMTGRRIQLRFEYTEDSNGDCTLAGHTAPCGVAVDNILVKHIVSAGNACGAGLSFFTVEPCRVVDTRNAAGSHGGPALAANTDRTFAVTGRCTIPAGARAIAGNVTVTGSDSPLGDLRLYPGGTPQPLVSTINYREGQTRANNILVPLGAAGDVTVRCVQSPGTSVHFLLDVTGYFE